MDNTAATTISSTILSTDTTIPVANANGLRSQGYINIGTETILYQNIGPDENGVYNQLLNCYRGQNGTTAAGHTSGDSVYVNYLPNVNIWPTGNPGTEYTLIYYRMRRMQDAGNGSTTQDIPFRWIPVMVAGIAYQLSMKLPDVDPNRVMSLKAEYEQQFQLAADEDREKAPARWVPRNMFYYR